MRFLPTGKRAEDIARDLGRAPGTVRMQIHRGLERLRRVLPAGIAVGAASVLHTRGLEVRPSSGAVPEFGPNTLLTHAGGLTGRFWVIPEINRNQFDLTSRPL